MATSGYFETTYYNNIRGLRFEWSRVGNPDTANNTTTISWKLFGCGSNPGTWYRTKNAYVNINGSRVWTQSGYTDVYVNTIVASGTTTIEHNADGTKTFSADAGGGIYSYTSIKTGSGSWTLDSIPRGAKLTNVLAFNDESNVSVFYDNPSQMNASSLGCALSWTQNGTPFTHWEAFSRTNTSGVIALTSNERDTIRQTINNSASRTLYVQLKTILNGTTYIDTRSVTCTIVNANPSFDSFTYNDINSTTTDITGDNQMIVQNVSICHINLPSATFSKYATLQKYVVTCNGVTEERASSNSTPVNLTIDSSRDVDCTLQVVDSRGYTYSQTITISMYSYTTPTAKVTLERENNYETSSTINVQANISSLGGHNQRQIMMVLMRDGVAPNPYDISTHNPFTFNADNNYDWNVLVQVRDALNGLWQETFLLPKGKFPLFVDTERMGISVNSFLNNGEVLRAVGGKSVVDSLKIGTEDVVDWIIEQGTSGDYKYQKWHSGKAEFWGRHELTVSSLTSLGNLYEASSGYTINYQNNLFIEVPTLITSVNGVGCSPIGLDIAGRGSSSATASIKCIFASNSGGTIVINIYAIGRWQ